MRFYPLLLLALLFVFWAIPAAHACQVMGQPDVIDIAAAEESASIIVVGQILDISYGDIEWVVTLTVEAEQYLKGSGLAQIKLVRYCATVAEIGGRYIFFLVPFDDGSYSIVGILPSGYETTIEASPEQIAAVQSMTNQSLPPQDLTPLGQLERFIKRNQLLLGQISLAVLGLSATALLLKRQNRRNPKLKRGEI